MVAVAAPGAAFGGMHGVRCVDLHAAVLGRDVDSGGRGTGVPDRAGRCGCGHQPVPALGRQAAWGRWLGWRLADRAIADAILV